MGALALLVGVALVLWLVEPDQTLVHNLPAALAVGFLSVAVRRTGRRPLPDSSPLDTRRAAA